MTVEEKVFYTEKKNVLENDTLKLLGFKYESASTLGMEKEGFYLIIKADNEKFEKDAVKEALKDVEEVKDEEKEKVLAKFRELEDNAGAGIAMFD